LSAYGGITFPIQPENLFLTEESRRKIAFLVMERYARDILKATTITRDPGRVMRMKVDNTWYRFQCQIVTENNQYRFTGNSLDEDRKLGSTIILFRYRKHPTQLTVESELHPFSSWSSKKGTFQLAFSAQNKSFRIPFAEE